MKKQSKAQEVSLPFCFLRSLVIQEEYLEMPKFVYCISILLGQIYLLLYTHQSHQEKNQDYFIESIFHYTNELLINQVIMNGVIIFFFIITLIRVLNTIYFVKNKKNIIQQQLKNENCIFQVFFTILSIESQLFIPLLFQVYFQLILKSIYTGFDKKSSVINYINSILSSASGIFLLLFTIIKIITTELSIQIKVKGFQKLSGLTQIIFQIFLKIMIIIFSAFNISDLYQINYALIFIQNLSQLSLIFYYHAYPQIQQIKFLIISIAFTFSFTITQIFALLNERSNSYILISCPFLYKIAMEQWYHQIQSLALKSQSNNQKKSFYLLVQQLNQSKNQNTTQIISNSLIIQEHRKRCINQQCPCKCWDQMLSQDIFQTLSYKIQQEFMINQIHDWKINLENSKNYQVDTMQIIQYCSALSEAKLFNLSFQQINIIIYNLNSKPTSTPTYQKQDTSKQSVYESSKTNNQKFYKQELLIYKNYKFSYFSKVKLQILQEKIQEHMKLQFNKNQNINNNQYDVSQAVSLFLESEKKNQNIKQKVFKALNQKLQFYQIFNSKQKISVQNFFSKAKKLSSKLFKIEIQLEKLYEQFPSQKLQSVNSFFQAEVMNNFIQAYKIGKITTISDEKLLNLNRNLTINFFSTKMIYLVFGFNEERNLKILQSSNNSSNFLGYDHEKFKNIEYIDQLLPKAIVPIHSKLVNQFLDTGKSKFYKSIQTNFIKKSNSLVIPIDFLFDLTFNSHNELNFIAFAQKQEKDLSQSIFILLNKKKKIQDFSDDIFTKFFVNNNPNLKLTQLLIGMRIQTLIPQLKCDKQYEKIFDGILIFLKDEYFELFSGPNQSTKNLKQLKSFWENEENQIYFSGNIESQKIEIVDDVYYIIEIKDVKKSRTQNIGEEERYKTTNTIFTIKVTDKTIGESQLKKMFEIDQIDLDISLEKQIEIPHKIDKIGFKKSSRIKHQQIELHNENSYSQNRPIDLMSPNESQSRLIKSMFSKRDHQQIYYINEEHKDGSEEFSSNEKQEINQKSYESLGIGNKNLKENIIKQLQFHQENQKVNANQSEASSIAGLKKSDLYKKQEYLNKIVTSKTVNTNINVMKFLVSFTLIICSIYSVLVLTILKGDLEQVLQEIDMLQVQGLFMGPSDEFIATQGATFSYTALLQQQIITAEEFAFNMKFLSKRLAQGFGELRDNFNSILKTSVLNKFFQNRIVKVSFYKQDPINFQYYNVSFRAALNIYLVYQYDFKNAFTQARAILDTPYFIYQFTNYFFLVDEFTKMNDDIHEYTIERIQQVNDKWILLSIMIQLICLMIILTAWYYHFKYTTTCFKIVELFQFVEKEMIEQDKDRYRILASILNKDIDIMFNYQLDIESKEKLVLKSQQDQKVQVKINHAKINFHKSITSSVFSLVSLLCVLGFFYFFSFFIIYIIEDYTIKYKPTTDLFRFISDLRFQIPKAYAYREISYFFPIFPFFGEEEQIRFYDEVYVSLDKMEEFNAILYNFNGNTYLSNQKFISLINKVKDSDICQFLDESLRKESQYYCDMVFGGTLRKGMIQTLSAMINHIRNEGKVNRFTQKLGVPEKDTEMSILIIRVIIQIFESFRAEIINITKGIIEYCNVFAILNILLAVVIILALYTISTNYYNSELFLSKRFILLLPSKQLLENNLMERRIKQLVVQRKLN